MCAVPIVAFTPPNLRQPSAWGRHGSTIATGMCGINGREVCGRHSSRPATCMILTRFEGCEHPNGKCMLMVTASYNANFGNICCNLFTVSGIRGRLRAEGTDGIMLK